MKFNGLIGLTNIPTNTIEAFSPIKHAYVINNNLEKRPITIIDSFRKEFDEFKQRTRNFSKSDLKKSMNIKNSIIFNKKTLTEIRKEFEESNKNINTQNKGVKNRTQSNGVPNKINASVNASKDNFKKLVLDLKISKVVFTSLTVAAFIGFALLKYDEEASSLTKISITLISTIKLGNIFYSILYPLLITASATATVGGFAVIPTVVAFYVILEAYRANS